MTRTDPESFLINAYIGSAPHPPGSYRYTFVYDIDWSQGSTTGTLEIRGPDRRPFELTRWVSNHVYVNGTGRWTNATTPP